MAIRKIKDAKDLSTNELIYFKGHAQATYMSDGRTVEEAVNNMGTGSSIDTSNFATKDELAQKQDIISDIDTIRSNAAKYNGTITGVSANGAIVAARGEANIPAASTSIYGVTKLSSATDSTSTTEAATPSAVKAAYDLADRYKGTVNAVKINGTTKTPSSGVVDLGTVITAHQTLKTINGESIVGSGDITISGGGSDENTIIMLYLNHTPYVGETGVFPSITASYFANAMNNHYIFYVYTGSDLVLPCSVWRDRIYIFNGPIYIDLLITKNFVDDTVEWECIEEAEIQKKLVSGTNIKTINGTSILGSGDIEISGGGGSSSGGSGTYSEVNHGTSDTTFTLTPNTFHIWDEVDSLTLDLGSETSGVANEFLFQFISGATATSLTLPDDIKWTGGEVPAIESNKIYQISILKGLGSVLEWECGSAIGIFTIIWGMSGTVDFNFDNGMTWQDFVDSDYNTDSTIKINGSQVFYTNSYLINNVAPTDTIINMNSYSTIYWD